MRVGLAQVNPTVGDLVGNVAAIVREYAQAVTAGCDIVAFPELSITGYPPEDLVLKPGFLADNMRALNSVVEATGNCMAVIGFVDSVAVQVDGGEERILFNAAAVAQNGKILGVYRKQLLPNYSVFDEERYFTPGPSIQDIFTCNGIPFAVSICEDLWVGDPTEQQAQQGAKLCISINGSPFHRNKPTQRDDLVSSRAQSNGVVVAYVNQIGGQDELVFDGGSLVADARGVIQARAAAFAAGGGGGASGAGTTAGTDNGGNGGAGYTWGDGSTYAGGGRGGGVTLGTPGTGQSSFGGGGNGSTGDGASGNAGVVKIRYLGAQRATGGTYTFVSGYSYHTFTTSGSLVT